MEREPTSVTRGEKTMADATAEFFDNLGRSGHEPLLLRATGTLRFDLAQGKRIERWLVTMRKGNVTVSRKNSEADCVARTDKALFDGIVSGRVNALASLLRGATGVKGDVELLVLFQRLFPGPPSSPERRAAGSARRE